MERFSQELLNQVRTSNDIVDIVSEYVQLTRHGKNYFGLCPFHDDNNPSMSVSPDKQIFRLKTPYDLHRVKKCCE